MPSEHTPTLLDEESSASPLEHVHFLVHLDKNHLSTGAVVASYFENFDLDSTAG